MTPERYEQLMDCFDAACGAEGEERGRIVAAVRAEDEDLAERLEELLEHDRGDLLQVGAGARLVQDELARPVDDPDTTTQRLGCEVDGYLLEDVLGRGGVGSVYRAVHQERGTVALKFLDAESVADARQVLRFRREFRAIARLDHPACLRVIEEGNHELGRYYVMEYMAGGDLRGLIKAPTEVLLPILLKVAEALDYIHSRGIVHRDLKPANVLLTADPVPRPKLADFGIARIVGVNPLTDGESVMGTIDYLSPEQLAELEADPRSDMYALGCMIHTLLAGNPPFRGPLMKRFNERLYGSAPSLRRTAPDAPEDLVALTDALLRRHPADRPQSSLEVAGELVAIVNRAGGGSRASLPAPSAGGFLYPPGFVGRESEFEQLVVRASAALDDRAGQAGLSVVSAPAGLGKSELLRQLEQRLRAKHVRTITVHGGSNTDVPQALAKELKLEDVSPEAAQTLNPFEGDEVEVARRRRVQELCDALATETAERPLMLVIEDLHEATPGAVKLLKALCTTIAKRRLPVFIAASHRSWDEEGAIGLRPLPRDATATMLATMLGVGAHQLPAGLLDEVCAGADGNPLLVQAHVRALVDSAALRRDYGGWSYEARASSVRGLEEPAKRLLHERLAELSREAQRVLRCASIAGRRFDVALLVSCSDIDEDDVIDALDEALRAGIVRSVAGPVSLDCYAFVHKWFAEVLYEATDDALRRRTHTRVGQILVDRGDASHQLLASHFDRGGSGEQAFRHAKEGAELAMLRHDYHAAERLFATTTRWIEAAPADERAAVFAHSLEMRADAHMELGCAADAVVQLEALCREDGSMKQRARWIRKLANAKFLGNDTDGAREAFHQVLALFGEHLPRTRFGLFWRIARERLGRWLGRRLRLRPRPCDGEEDLALAHRGLTWLARWTNLEHAGFHTTRYLRLAERIGNAATLVDALAAEALAWMFLGHDRALSIVRSGRDLARHEGNQRGVARIEMMRGMCDLFVADDSATAVKRMRASVELAQRLGDRHLVGLGSVLSGWTHIFHGQYDVAFDDARRGLRMGQQLDLDWLRADATGVLMVALILTGRFEEGVRTARELCEFGESTGLPAFHAFGIEALGSIALLEGDFRNALRLLQQARDEYMRHRLSTGWGFMVNIQLSEAALGLAETEGAAAVPDLDAMLKRNAKLASQQSARCRPFRGYDHVLLGAYHRRRGNPAAAARLFDHAMEVRKRPEPSPIDWWIDMRIAIERSAMGVPKDEVRQQLDKTKALLQRHGARGLLKWEARVRERHGL